MSEEANEEGGAEAAAPIHSEDFLAWFWNSDEPAAQQAREAVAHSENSAVRQEVQKQGYEL